ncbi:MAG: ABC transporter permease subunit [Casimicrobiaceae bacterium]|nr:ABC transporter permease subunit [Casimicrobiaceae bacterium]MCX8097436.1 ABC transporter permease subunit [Casimicrobiaceae bacterium]MDW8312070.1 ABC transporter permease subunit [Burkholderiales bacterium]
MTPSSRPAPGRSRWSWRSQAVRGVLYQLLALALVILIGWWLVSNTATNMQARGIQSGFDFLQQPAGFDIGEPLFGYEPGQSYFKAFLVGVGNTLRVAVIGIVLATILGTLLGIGRFSRNALVRGFCYAYVEFFRNVPVLVQLLMWYLLATEILPDSTAPWQFGNVFLSKGGLSFPAPVWTAGHLWMFVGLLAGIAGAWWYWHRMRREFEATGIERNRFGLAALLVIGGGVLGWLLGGMPNEWRVPVKGEFAVEGGAALTPEFLAVLMGLVLYTAAFIAEVVRAGIASVPHGQSEAARSLGLSRSQEMRLVLLPQALRVIIPPMTNQYLNLTKNSSLSVAIGYPDVVSIANTALNQTGRAVECIAIIMAVYLTTSLTTSVFMNWYNARAAIKER